MRMVKRYKNQKGEDRICGGPDLKASQAYPRGRLGYINQLIWICNIDLVPPVSFVWLPLPGGKLWEDAGLPLMVSQR